MLIGQLIFGNIECNLGKYKSKGDCFFGMLFSQIKLAKSAIWLYWNCYINWHFNFETSVISARFTTDCKLFVPVRIFFKDFGYKLNDNRIELHVDQDLPCDLTSAVGVATQCGRIFSCRSSSFISPCFHFVNYLAYLKVLSLCLSFSPNTEQVRY